MSLPHLLKHVYKTGSEEAIVRGKKIFLAQGVRLIHNDEIVQQLIFRVRNDLYHNYYNVTISRYTDEQLMQVRCKCPYNMGDVCRHEAAALYFLHELIITNSLESSEKSFDQKNTTIKMRNIELKLLRLYASDALFESAEEIANLNKVKIHSAKEECVIAEIPIKKESFDIILKRNDDGTFNTSCTCDQKEHPLCSHKTALFLQLLNNQGANYFDSIRNWDVQKNKLLGLYGYSLEDKLEGKFDFYYKEGKPFLKVLDNTIKKLNEQQQVVPDYLKDSKEEVVSAKDYKKGLGVLINFNHKLFPYFQIQLIDGQRKEDTKELSGLLNLLDTSKYIDFSVYSEEDRAIASAAKKIQKNEIDKYISRNSPFGDLWESITSEDEWTPENKKLYYEYAIPKLKKLFNLLGTEHPLFYLPKGKLFKATLLKSLVISSEPTSLSFALEGKGKQAKLSIAWQVGKNQFKQEENLHDQFTFLIHQENIFLPNDAQDAICADALLFQFPSNAKNWEKYMEEIVLPYSKTKNINLDKSLVEKTAVEQGKEGIVLSERSNYFMIKPVFTYRGVELDWSNETQYPIQANGKIIMVQRDKNAERAFVEKVEKLHPKMRLASTNDHFLLESKFALSENWIYTFFQKVKEWEVNLFGYENLQQFKFKKLKPKTKINISSNIDWFDTEIELDFGGEKADLKELQKSIQSKQNYVKLSDGTLGLLPEEWLKKYSLLFKMSDLQGNKLKVKKVNFHIIDELYDNISEEDIKHELEERKRKLLRTDIPSAETIIIPSEIQADLRPYQKAGYQWLGYLQEANWGGLLADDMGLGKTIQSLVVLQDYKNRNGILKAIIVCPTTLLYNWKNEIEKFTPTMSYYIHHGATRTAKEEVIDKHDIIITTYGTLRSDITFLNKAAFDYIILDESQAIKNPTSKTAKAAFILEGKHKIALSGTPMQNNTFDIYSQMNFLNPGMLGSKEFFKENFSIPIDKFQEATAKEHLKKIIFPFLLRRTKEQVAKDLPEKSEITLLCEMGKEQQRIYDQYKNLYRSKILGELDTRGLQKSQFSILQGLMRLRQICDSPSIIKGEESGEVHSIKLEELTEQLRATVGNHKVLIFSQFLGMLSLIREKLKEENIDHEYFDGSFNTTKRQDAINRFQQDENCRVFVISLKAGGMGLNLTEADYVYIMDPWWNPAVEQQAIDRTHRIGQTKNIFAYRFICKDSVEEKIMKLKDKKNALVNDIVSDDTGFVKNLTREDIEYLFS